jgi:DNA polymerase IV
MQKASEPIIHVDMDAFYASVEQRDDPSLQGKPVAVGGLGPRSVVAACSYEARRFGVRSAMPMVQARRLCRNLIVVTPDFSRYTAESKAIRTIFDSITPLVEMLSLDEAFLDVAGATRLFGEPVEIADRIRRRIKQERGLPASAGVARNKSVAKLASEAAKPDGLVHVPANESQDFLDPLPVGALWGVGEQTVAALERFGVRTVKDLRELPDGVLDRAFGPASAQHLWHAARGIDERPVVVHEPPKQISAEQTFDRDLDSDENIHKELLRLSDRVASRLRQQGASARTVILKVRFNDFRTITRSKTIEAHTDSSTHIYATAKGLYAALRLARPRIRLLGVSAQGLSWEGVPEQLALDHRPDPWRAAEKAIDHVRSKYGKDAMSAARVAESRPLIKPPPPPLGKLPAKPKPGTVTRIDQRKEQ